MMDFSGKSDEQIVKLLTSHYNNIQSKRKDFESLWAVLVKLFMPRRYDLLRNQTAGQQYGAKVYDDHPANAANKHVLGILGHTISKTMPWLQFSVSRQRMMENDETKQYLEEAAEQILWSFGRTNFYGSNFWAKKDETVIGTGTLWPEEDLLSGKVIYTPIHPGETYIEDDQYGQEAVFIRPFKYTALKLYEKFGKEKLPQEVVKNATGTDSDSNPFKVYDCLLSVYKNRKFNADSLLPEDKKYKVFYVLMNSGENESKRLLMKSGIDYFPIIRRYGKDPENAYGTSLAADALTSSLIANKLGEKSLQLVHKLVEPPMLVHSNLRGNTNFNAGGRTYVDDTREDVKQIYQGNGWPLSDAQMDRLHNEIDDRFFIRFFELLSGRDLPQITAYQASRMEGEKVTLMNALINNEEEFLGKAVDVQWDFETKAGRMPDVPAVLLDTDGRIDVKYIGPLFQAQRQLLKTRGTVEWLQLVAGINNIWPNAKIKINELELIEDAGIAMGMQQKFFKSDEEVKAILDSIAEQEEQAAQLQMAGEMAKAVPSLQGKTEKGSPMEMLAGAIG